MQIYQHWLVHWQYWNLVLYLGVWIWACVSSIGYYVEHDSQEPDLL